MSEPAFEAVGDDDPLADIGPLMRRVRAYVGRRVASYAEAEEVTAETFARAQRYRASFDRDKGEPIGWLIGIARREIATRAAKGGREVPSESLLDLVAVREFAPPREFEHVESRIVVEQFLAREDLTAADRRIIRAIVNGDGQMTDIEIAAESEISSSTLYLRLAVLEQLLRKTLGPDFTESVQSRRRDSGGTAV